MKRWLLAGAIVAGLIGVAAADEKAKFDPEVEATLAPMPADSQNLARCVISEGVAALKVYPLFEDKMAKLVVDKCFKFFNVVGAKNPMLAQALTQRAMIIARQRWNAGI
jgi:hypothetical protein